MNGVVQGRTAQVLYGTETGNAQDLAEELGRVTERLRFFTSIAELDSVPLTGLFPYTITVFVLSTTGQGEFPSNAKGFWTNLLKKKLSATFLRGVSFFLIGLGDTSYPQFNWAARKLGKRLKQLGASEIIDSCEADEQGEESTDGAFLAWLPLFKAALLERFPMPNDLLPIPDEQPLPSKWVLGHTPAEVNGHAPNTRNGNQDEKTVEKRKPNGVGFTTDADHDPWPIPDSFQVRLEENQRVTPSSHWQDVRLLTLTTNQSIKYRPGDALSILPKNSAEDVNILIHLMEWSSVADSPIVFTPTTKPTDLTNYPPSPIPYLSSSTIPLTLRMLLTSYLDITSIPRRSLFATLSLYTTDQIQRDRLLEFTLPQYLDEYYDYATRPRRTVLEILQEFDTVKIPWQEVANVFHLLRGRQFSIASGGMLRRFSVDNGPNSSREGQGTKFELLVAIVKYKTVMKKIRQGLCTRYLAELAPGSMLHVVLRTDGRFFDKRQKQPRKGVHSREKWEMTPKLLIGAGTGIAPLRAIILGDEDRVQKGEDPVLTTLFFGSRNHDKDFFFTKEWTAKLARNENQNQHQPALNENEGAFKLITAFSRDQKQKVYLQDRLREHAALVFDMIVNKHATVVVCGSSGAMPKAVRQAIVDVLLHQGSQKQIRPLKSGKMGEGEKGFDDRNEQEWKQQRAEQYLRGMEKSRRYLQETW